MSWGDRAPSRSSSAPIGPTLTSFDPVSLNPGVVLADPVLQLTKSDGTVLASNDGWGGDPMVAAAARPSAGAFALPAGSKDAAMVVTLPPGAYTALVTGKNGATGVALVEVYDLDTSAASRLINISTRAQAGTGAQSLIAGFAVAGSGARDVLIRAVGPSLTAFDPADLGPTCVLADPELQLQALGGPVLASNDDWYPGNGAAIAAAANAVNAFCTGSRLQGRRPALKPESREPTRPSWPARPAAPASPLSRSTRRGAVRRWWTLQESYRPEGVCRLVGVWFQKAKVEKRTKTRTKISPPTKV